LTLPQSRIIHHPPLHPLPSRAGKFCNPLPASGTYFWWWERVRGLSMNSLASPPLRKFQGCDRRRALRILGCLSEASSQNSARLTEQTGPEGEIFVGAAYFGLPFLAVKEMDSEQRERITRIFFPASKTFRSSKVTGAWGNAPFRAAFNTLPCPAVLIGRSAPTRVVSGIKQTLKLSCKLQTPGAKLNTKIGVKLIIL